MYLPYLIVHQIIVESKAFKISCTMKKAGQTISKVYLLRIVSIV